MLLEIGIFIVAGSVLATAVIAFLATKEIKNATQATLKGIEAKLLIDLLGEYSSDEMTNAVQTLKNWKTENKEAYISEFEERYKMKDVSIFPVLRACRIVLRYFQRVLQLYEGGYVSGSFCNTIFGLSGTDVLFEIVEPFEVIAPLTESNKPIDIAVFDRFHKLCEKKTDI